MSQKSYVLEQAIYSSLDAGSLNDSWPGNLAVQTREHLQFTQHLEDSITGVSGWD